LHDEELLAALQLRAQWRGLELSHEAAGFLLRRVTREAAALFELLDVADQAALAAQRKLTVPFLKSVLESKAR
jgi:DnaA family protein